MKRPTIRPWCRFSPPLAVLLSAGVVLGAIGLTSCSSRASSARTAREEPVSIATPLATSVETPDGTWVTIPMGHLAQPLNTFWQLFFEPKGSTSWSNKVQATAVATNGGIVLASAGSRPLLVGVRPSNLLTYSPLVASSNGGRSWSNGVLSEGLTDHPDALAIDSSGHALALVADRSGTQVLASSGNLLSWRALITESQLASTAAGRACRLTAITAVGYVADSAVTGAACARPGVVGVLAERDHVWRLAGPGLPSSLAEARVEVLALHSTRHGLSALLGLSGGGKTGFAAAWTGDGSDAWQLSPELLAGVAGRLASFGPVGATGMFVLLSGSVSSEKLYAIAGASGSWQQLQSPPARTETVAFGPNGTVDAFTVDDTVLTVWALRSRSDRWTRGQVTDVPIQFGSSS
jgi:hypothetical protein